MPATNKSTCLTCRSRKVRCDGKRPTCDRCINARRSCSYNNQKRHILFRHSKLSSVTTESLTGNRSDGEEQDDSCDIDISTAQQSQASHRFGDEAPSYQSTTVVAQSHESAGNHGTSPTAQGISPLSVYPSKSTPISHASSSAPTPWDGSHASQSSRRKTLSPLEGELLGFYVCNIGPWLDVTSPERHYTYTVPSIALRWPLLLYAIMTCSAHIRRLISRDRYDLVDKEAKYQHQCLELLIPMLSDLSAAAQDEVVLATIAILRMSEQYDEFHVDRQFHLVPQAFDHFRGMGSSSSTTSGGLREATFYSYVRADIRMAILGRCGTRMKLDSWPLDTQTLITDADWANRMTYLLVQVLNLCLGHDVPGVLPQGEISWLVDEWRQNLPESFEPYYYREASNDESFPLVRVLCPWHMVGLQFYHAAKILLATIRVHERAGSDILNFNRYVSSEILFHARILCGISFSNDHHGCRMNSSHLIALGAQYFTGRQEQRQVLDYFEMLQNEKAWPGGACKGMLEMAWG